MTASANQERFVALLDEHRGILRKVTYAYCRNPEDRSDLTQEIVVQLWRSFERFDPSKRFSTWMYQIAMNVAISHLRDEGPRIRDTISVDDLVLEIPADDPQADETSDSIRMLYQFISQFDELNKALIILYLDGNSYDTIAEILGISTTNVATKISRIKQRLRQSFGA